MVEHSEFGLQRIRPVGTGLDIVYYDGNLQKSVADANPIEADFQNLINGLARHVILDNFMLGADMLGKKLTELSEVQRTFYHELVGKMSFKELKISGSKSDKCQIQFTLKGLNGGSRVVKTGKLNIKETKGSETYPYWDELSELVEKLSHESLKFVNQKD
jgi:hypothetical protein